MINAFLSGLLIFALGSSAPKIAAYSLRERIAMRLRQATAEAKIAGPFLDLTTRLPSRAALYRRVVDAVVYIVTGKGTTGSGTVISRSFGLIITNRHVVRNEKIVGLVFKPKGSSGRISFDKDDLYFAQVLKTDSIRDLALLQVVSPPRKMIAVPLGSVLNLEVGHFYFRVGHQKGFLWGYTDEMISDILPNYEWASHDNTIHRANAIQTQTVTGQGNSTGPLFDENGQFIGLSVGTLGAGLNLVITVDEMREFVFSFLDPLRNGVREHPSTKDKKERFP